MFRKNKTNIFAGIGNKTVNLTWIVISVPIFLLAAFFYNGFTPAKYEVSARIAVNPHQQAEDIIKDIRHKNLVSAVISKMQLTVDYYHRLNLKTKDIYGDSLPVKLVMLNDVKIPAEVKITILNNQQYEIDKDDTVEDIPFNRPETYEFGRFMVVRGPAFKVDAKPVIVKLNPETALVNDYENNLDAKADEAGFIDLSIKTTSVAKGKAFLKLLGNAFSTTVAKPVIVVKQINKNSRLDSIITQLQALNAKAATLRQRQALLAGVKKPKDNGGKSDAPKSVQQQVLQVIKPYAATTVAQFVQIPYSNQLTDAKLAALVIQFNRLQLEKQKALLTSKSDGGLPAIYAQLLKLKANMLQRIDMDLAGMQNTMAATDLPSARVMRDSIHKTDMAIKSKLAEYRISRASKPILIKPAQPDAAQPVVVSPEQSTAIYPERPYIFILALIAGLTIPVLINYVLFYLRIRFFKKAQQNRL